LFDQQISRTFLGFMQMSQKGKCILIGFFFTITVTQFVVNENKAVNP